MHPLPLLLLLQTKMVMTLMSWSELEELEVEQSLSRKWLKVTVTLRKSVTLKRSAVDASEQTGLWRPPTALAVTYIHKLGHSMHKICFKNYCEEVGYRLEALEAILLRHQRSSVCQISTTKLHSQHFLLQVSFDNMWDQKNNLATSHPHRSDLCISSSYRGFLLSRKLPVIPVVV